MTPEARARVLAAMEASGGNRRVAADALGIRLDSLHQMIYNDQEMIVRYTKSTKKLKNRPELQPHTVSTAMGRDSIIQNRQEAQKIEAIKQSVDIERAIDSENKKLKRGLATLGLSDSEVDLAQNLQKFMGRHLTQVSEVIGGGIALQAVKIQTRIQKDFERLDNGFNGSPDPIAEEKMVRESIHRYMDTLEKYQRVIDENANKKALIALRTAEVKGGAVRGKPGFGPLVATQINVSGNGMKVELKDDPNPNNEEEEQDAPES